ncbi:HAD family phosphatase [Candidatus Nitrosocosmicus oleophilus]|nr:HAD family phosphatase [Candidatus Nitrosocosmicus oleophilus]
MKGILFDMDGVLIDAMPFHAEAFQKAFREIVKIDIDKRNVFLLEGMPGPLLIREIFKRSNLESPDEKLVENISNRKKGLFEELQRAGAFPGVKELIESLNCKNCLTAVVSGASRKEVESLLEQNNLSKFDLIISSEDLEEGKPNPQPFIMALSKLKLNPSEALVVENAPLGVESAVKANIEYIVTLNNTPLELSDFRVLNDNDFATKNVYEDTQSAAKFLIDWCCRDVQTI